MKYVFVAGLEHSGTTLTDHLLSQHSQVLGLGEVASFFSCHHMKNYMQQWGDYTDAQFCSCGRPWNECPFWAEILELNGLNTDWPMPKKYSRLFRYINSKYKNVEAIVDSSKNIQVLQDIIGSIDALDFNKVDIYAIFVVKDVRSFAASISKKTNNKSIYDHIKTFNWWYASNNKILEYLNGENLAFRTVLYEKLCQDPDGIVGSVLAELGLKLDKSLQTLHSTSHIAMGNKDFTIRNKDRIYYDQSWYLDDNINLTYLLHRKVRRFSENLYVS